MTRRSRGVTSIREKEAMRHKLLAKLAATTTMMVITQSPSASNGIGEEQFPFGATYYVGCLGQDVELSFLVTRRWHSFERNNGSTHFVENWFGEGVAVGLDSGLTWYTKNGPAPWVSNVNGEKVSPDIAQAGVK
jgi:hypothetical protein